MIGEIDHRLSNSRTFFHVNGAEMSTGRMDPRVGSGRIGSGLDFAGFWRVGPSRVSTSDFKIFY